MLKRQNITSSKSSDDNIESKDQYLNGALVNKTKFDMDNELTKIERDKTIVSSVDKITKLLYPSAYMIFNVVYWYQLKSG